MNMPPTCEAAKWPESKDPSCGAKAVWVVFNKTRNTRMVVCDGCLRSRWGEPFVEGCTHVVFPVTDYSKETSNVRGDGQT